MVNKNESIVIKTEERPFKKKTRNPINLATKKRIIIEKVHNNRTLDSISQEFGIDRSTVGKIVKNRDKIEAYLLTDPSRCRIQGGQLGLVEDALFKWYSITKSQNLPVSQYMLKEKALSFYENFKQKGVTQLPAEFEASTGWLQKFKLRFGLTNKRAKLDSTTITANEVNTVDHNITNTVTTNEEEILEMVLQGSGLNIFKLDDLNDFDEQDQEQDEYSEEDLEQDQLMGQEQSSNQEQDGNKVKNEVDACEVTREQGQQAFKTLLTYFSQFQIPCQDLQAVSSVYDKVCSGVYKQNSQNEFFKSEPL